VAAHRVEPELAERLAKYGLPYTRARVHGAGRHPLSWLVPALIFVGVWFLLIRRMTGAQNARPHTA
jgi:cell division protease FtsH